MPHVISSSQSLEKTMLLLIDVQSGFDEPSASSYFGTERSNPKVHDNINAVLKTFRAASQKGGPSGPLIAHIYHSSISEKSPLHPSKPGVKFSPYAEPKAGEFVDVKTTNSAFIGTGLADYIRASGITELFICGLTTEHCVSTSTRMAANLGVVDRKGEGGQVRKGRIVLIEDATAAYNKWGLSADIVHRVNVACLRGEFAEISTADEVIQEISSRRNAVCSL